jgi:hypothetical protein
MEDTDSDNKDHSGIIYYITHHWNYLFYIIIGLLVASVVINLSRMFGPGSALSDATKTIFKDGQAFYGSFFTCCSQSTCSNYTSEDDCKNACGCIFTEGKGCSNNTGRKEGSNGIFSSTCAGGILAILWVISLLAGPLMKLMYNYFYPNKLIELFSSITGKSYDKSFQELYDDALEKLKDVNTDRDSFSSDDEYLEFLSKVTLSTIEKKLSDEIKVSDPAAKEQREQMEKEVANTNKAIEDKSGSNVSQEDRDIIDEKVKKEMEKK